MSTRNEKGKIDHLGEELQKSSFQSKFKSVCKVDFQLIRN
jgi:hypothetical protein